MKGCVQCFWLTDHMEFLEEVAVTRSPVEPKFCRIFVVVLSLSSFILWHRKLVGLGSAAFPFGFPLPHNKRTTGFVLNFDLAPARPLCDSEHLVGKVLSCSRALSILKERSLRCSQACMGQSEWGQLKTPLKSLALFC